MKTSKFLIFPLILGTLCFQISPAYSQRAYVKPTQEFFEYLLRKFPKRLPPRSYKIIDNTLTTTGYVVTTIKTANGVYQIVSDCHQGLASENINYLPPDQRVNLMRDVCRNYLR